VGIGNVASEALANGTLLVGERKMLKEMKEQGYRVLLYKRYIDDIMAIFEHQDGVQKRKGAEMMEKLINGLDSKDGSIKVTPAKGISSMRKREKETQEESVEYLDVEIVLTGQSEMRLETGIYRKEAAADMYIQANSAHPWAQELTKWTKEQGRGQREEEGDDMTKTHSLYTFLSGQEQRNGGKGGQS